MTTEQEWLDAQTVIDLDLYRTTKKQVRKWRLFGVACARRALVHFPDPRLEPLADAAERFADGLLSWEAVKRVRKGLAVVRREMGDEFGPDEARIDVLNALDRATWKEALGATGASEDAQSAFRAATRLHLTREEWQTQAARDRRDAAGNAEERVQVTLAYDIFGNPFRPITFNPTWRTATVEAIAAGCYAERAFDRLPVLADALADAGCDAADLLAHLRGPGPHARGCCALDLVLGKS